MLISIKQVIERARQLARTSVPTVAVAGAEDDDVLKAVGDARDQGIIGAVLVGSAAKIRKLLSELGLEAAAFEIVDAPDVKTTVMRAVELCSAGTCRILMKGKVPTPDLMKAVLMPHAGLRHGQLLSHCAIIEFPGYPKLLSITDGGVVVSADFEQKLALAENAVRVSRFLGIEHPRVAFLGVLNEADPDFPSTVEAAALARTCRIQGIARYADGPLTFETAIKGIPSGASWTSEVAGQPDILVAHGIEEVNISVKAITNLRGAGFMGVITGARVPLSLVSRSDPPENKLASLALAAVIAGEAQ
jgi:phosphate butyryltransferase